tara:strand:+ start:39 stop:1496 length:1458 start_codon:yes stop_codon:yes gene_type:complete
MPVKNKQKGKEPKVKNDKTAQQEQCSVVAIYYALNKDMSKQATQDELFKHFSTIYPKITEKDGILWKQTFLEQAEVFKKNTKYYRPGGDYLYGWWDAPTQAIGKAPFAKAVDQKTTSLLTEIWDNFDTDTKKVFDNKKDTWNTADMYMVLSGHETGIKNWIKELKKEFIGEVCCDEEVYIGTINTFLTQLMKLKILIPISLKKKTPGKDVKITETNMHEWDKGEGELDIVSGGFTKSPKGPGPYPWANFNLIKEGSEITFGPKEGKSGNSFQYFAEFKVGDYRTEYLVEQRLTNTGSKGEVKEIVLTNKGASVRSHAQTGSVPHEHFKELIYDKTGEKYEMNVPGPRTPLSKSEVDYWAKYLEFRMREGRMKFDLGNFEVFGEEYPWERTKGMTWIEKVAEIDREYLNNPQAAASVYKIPNAGNFHREFRLKLVQLRFLKALQNANNEHFGKSEGLAKFLTHVYYMAAKQNVSEGDIHGPFLKLS